MNELLVKLYWACTDFCIHLANLLDISYVESTVYLLMIGLPLAVIVLLVLNIMRWWKRRT
ncbi:MAG: hypothetical protein AAGJ82_05290 [Bacteroidota bacterium]